MKFKVTMKHAVPRARRVGFTDFVVDAVDGDGAYRAAQTASRERGLTGAIGVDIEQVDVAQPVPAIVKLPVSPPVAVHAPARAAKPTKVRAANPILAALDAERDVAVGDATLSDADQ